MLTIPVRAHANGCAHAYRSTGFMKGPAFGFAVGISLNLAWLFRLSVAQTNLGLIGLAPSARRVRWSGLVGQVGGYQEELSDSDIEYCNSVLDRLDYFHHVTDQTPSSGTKSPAPQNS